MHEVKIKPLSVNECWQGRRFRTPKYKAYQTELGLKLPKIKVPAGNLKVTIEWGLKNMLQDVDNGVKPFLDICQKKYGFNDRDIMQLDVSKRKSKEFYIKFNITSNLKNNNMEAPQIIYIVLTATGLLIQANKHGQAKEGKENFWSSLIAGLIVYGLLIWGGFFAL